MEAVVLAYARPELLEITTTRLMQEPAISEILIVVDGLSQKNDVSTGYEATKRKARQLAKSYSLKTAFYDSNIGLTPHIFRVFFDYLSHLKYFLLCEDDKLYLSGLDNAIQNNYQLMERSKGISILSSGQLSHYAWNNLNLSYPTVCMEVGLSVIGNNLIREASQVFGDKRYTSAAIEPAILRYCKELEIEGKWARRIVNYWSQYFQWGVNSKRRPDSLFSYVLALNGLYRNVQADFSHLNIHQLDFRGENLNHQEEVNQIHNLSENSTLNSSFCFDCEKKVLSARSPFSNVDLFRSRRAYLKSKVSGVLTDITRNR